MQRLNLLLLALLCSSSLVDVVVTANAGSSLPSSTLLPGYDGEAILQKDDTTTIALDDALLLDDSEEDDWRRKLPPELRNNKGAPLHRIEMGGDVVLYLLGSSHVSVTSCDDVRLLMQHVRPDVLFVELCSDRVGLLLPIPHESEQQQQQQQQQLKDNKKNNGMSSLSQKGNMLYAKIQSDYAKKLNVTIGGEFRVAFQEALTQQLHFWKSKKNHLYDPYNIMESYTLPPNNNNVQRSSDSYVSHERGNRACTVILGDRPVKITILRAWESLRWFGKFKLMLALAWSSIKQPSEKELREWMESILNDRSGRNDLITKSMEQLGKVFPTMKRVIIEERDMFMAAKLKQVASIMRNSHLNGEKVIVAVVGAGHCPGMLEKLMQKYDETTDTVTKQEERPEIVLPRIVETKKRRLDSDAEVSSLVTDLVQFDYAYVLESQVLQ